jgi:hypothetical protein
MKIKGTVESIIFQNVENWYTVVDLDCNGDLVTASGTFPPVSEGEEVELTGKTIAIDGTENNVKCLSYLVVDGDESVIETKDKKIIAQKEGSLTLRTCTTFTKGNIEYDVYSSPITITVGARNSQTSQNQTVGDGVNYSGCNGNITEQTIIFAPVLLCAYIVATLKKKGKENG